MVNLHSSPECEMKTYMVLVAIAGVLLMCIGCSQSVLKESGFAPLESLYASGMDKLRKNDQKGAEEDFRAIIKRDRKSPMGYTGIALVELNRSEFRQGLLAINRVVQQNPDFVDAYIVLGRILTEQKKKAWFRDSIEAFEQALNRDPDNNNALYYCGESYLANYAFDRAEQYFNRALQQQGALKDSASAKLAFVTQIIKAGPVSKEGKHLIVDTTIDRAELCVLLIEELKIKELLKLYRLSFFQELFTLDFKLKKENISIPADVQSHPRRQWIVDSIPLQLPDLSILPDHKFYTDRPVTRAQLAVIVHGVHRLLSDSTEVSEGRVVDESVIPDVRSDYYAFEAIKFCVGNGVMQPGSSGAFRPYDTVSGLETIRTIRNLQELLSKRLQNKAKGS